MTRSPQSSLEDLLRSTEDHDRGTTAPLVAAPGQRTCILVLGMHRSGTSALTRVISLLGAALPRELLGAGPGNEVGHWEPARLIQYHDEILAELGSRWDDWRRLDVERVPSRRQAEVRSDIRGHITADYGDAPLIVLKEPRICRFAPLFLGALDEAGYDTRVVIPFRNPIEVIGSLEHRASVWADEHTRTTAALIWLRHALDAEAATRSRPRAIISYDGLLDDWRAALSRCETKLGMSWPYAADAVEPQIASFLSGERRNHRATTEDVRLDPALKTWIADAYEALLVLERDPASTAALATLDRIRRTFDDAAPVMERLVAEQLARAEAAVAAERSKAAAAVAQERSAAEAAVAQERSAAEAVLAQERTTAEAAVAKERNAAEVALTQERTRAEASALELATVRVSMTADLAAARVEIARLENALAAACAKVDAGTHELATVREAMAADVTGLRAEVERLEKALAEASAKVEAGVLELATVRETMAADLSASRAEVHRLEGAFAEALAQAEVGARELETMRQDMAADLASRADAAALVHDIEGKLQAERRRTVEVERTLEAMMHERESAREAAALAQAHTMAVREAYERSTSWKLTAPIRGAKRTQVAIGRFFSVLPVAAKYGGGMLLTARRDARIRLREEIGGVWWHRKTDDHGAIDPAAASMFPTSHQKYESADLQDYRLLRAPSVQYDKAVCLFVTHSADGGLKRNALRLCAQHRQVGIQVILLVATDSKDLEIQEPEDQAYDGLVAIRNGGYDFACWALALRLMPDLRECERVIFANDSVVGPGSAFESMIQTAFRSSAEFVGLVESHQRRHHYQSFWFLLSRQAFRNEAVVGFWNGVRTLSTKEEVIDEYELAMLETFRVAGLRCEALFPLLPQDRSVQINPTHQRWDQLLRRGFPFIKCELLRSNPTQASLADLPRELEASGIDPEWVSEYLRTAGEHGAVAAQVLRETSLLLQTRRSPFLRLSGAGYNKPQAFCVLGSARSGTSMVAGLLQMLGVNMGKVDPDNNEDVNFLSHNGDREFLASDSDGRKVYIDGIVNYIHSRQSEKRDWGWKDPLAMYYVPHIIEQIDHPGLIVVSRDWVASCQSELWYAVGAGPLDRERALAQIASYSFDLGRMFEIIMSREVPTLMISYERAVSHPERLVRGLAEFAGKQISSADARRLIRYVQRDSDTGRIPANF